VRSELTDERLLLKRRPGGLRPRRFVQLEGLSPDHKLGIYNGDLDTLACGLLERMYYCKVGGEFVAPPQVNAHHVESELSYFRDAVLNECGRPPRLSLQEVVDTYTGRKRTLYQNALESLNRKPLDRKDARCKAFVKVEKGVLGKAPRVIQPRDPRYNLHVGQYIKPLEHRIYRGIAKVFGDGPTVMKGYNVLEIGGIIRGKWRSFSKPVALGIDAVKFDMHVSRAILEFEHRFYTGCYKDKALKKLLLWQIFNQGVGYCSDGKLQYTVEGRRFSGDMNTALGNCIIMCALVHAYSKSRGVATKLINNGDDCVVFMESRDLSTFMDGFSEWFLDFGFRMTIEEPVYELEKIEFCQMHPVWTPQGVTMVRNVKRALAKDTMAIVSVINEGAARTWLRAIGKCGASLATGVPVIQEFYKLLTKQSMKDSKIMQSATMQSGFQMLSRKMVGGEAVISAESRVSFMTAFGLTPDEQRAYEQLFSNFEVDYQIAPTDSTVPITFEI
jgi:hypothetical protein